MSRAGIRTAEAAAQGLAILREETELKEVCRAIKRPSEVEVKRRRRAKAKIGLTEELARFPTWRTNTP